MLKKSQHHVGFSFFLINLHDSLKSGKTKLRFTMKRTILILVSILFTGCIIETSAQDISGPGEPAFRIMNRFVGGIELSLAPSRTVNEEIFTPTTINFKAGYKMRSTLAMASMGIEYLNGENFIPLAVEFRHNISSSIWAPFTYAKAGDSFHLKRNINSRSYTANYDQYDPALFLGAGLGYSFATNLNEFFISLGYNYHALEKIEVDQYGEERTDMSMNGVSFTVGFIF